MAWKCVQGSTWNASPINKWICRYNVVFPYFQLVFITLFIFNIYDDNCNFGKACAPFSRQNINRCYSAATFKEISRQNKQSWNTKCEMGNKKYKIQNAQFSRTILVYYWFFCMYSLTRGFSLSFMSFVIFYLYCWLHKIIYKRIIAKWFH